ncbi:degenerin deg-1 [Parasteatoda tepidariorum]|uniref:degenerin deg-1 n=1 Tax=Parasteatoda tepidariorum TaxID=114398 RepID=UPI00077FC67E|nr:degenerin deg-1 [Parasteatoda tepidariorum]
MVRKRKEDFGNYVAGILQNSMLTGIPQIAGAGNAPKRIIRALVFVACLIGFIYQSLVFMNLYWEYKTVIDVQVLTSKEADLPSVTVCNYNGLYRSKICNDSRFESRCSKLTNDAEYGADWCECLGGRWCKNGVLDDVKVVDWQLYREINMMEYSEYEMLLQDFEEFFDYCTIYQGSEDKIFTKCDMKNYEHVRCPGEDSTMGTCWTLNTIIGQPEAEPRKVLSNARLTIVVFPHAEEYSTEIKSVTAQVAIHNPRQIVNPYTNGFHMKVNTRQDFRLKKVVKKLLPAPYETNCVDYVERWKSRGGRGPTNQKECDGECQKNVSLEVYGGCLSQYFYVPGNERRCGVDVIPKGDVIAKIAECQKKHCNPACYDEHYEIVRDVRDRRSQADCGFDEFKSFAQDIGMFIYLNGMETTTYTYSPKYQNIETFSYLGGYVGMWLGISLVAVFDFLETVIIMMRYPFRKLMESRAKKERLQHIKKLQRDL